nr:phage late control D family protein [Pseudomonas aeruginosa]
AIVWLGGNLHHSFTPDSYTTSLELESKLPDGDDVDLLADHDGDYTGVVAWYRDEKTGEQKKLTAGDQTKPKRLTHLYASKANAQRAVDRELKRLQESRT